MKTLVHARFVGACGLLTNMMFAAAPPAIAGSPAQFQIDQTQNPSPVCIVRDTATCDTVGKVDSAHVWHPSIPAAAIDVGNLASGTAARSLGEVYATSFAVDPTGASDSTAAISAALAAAAGGTLHVPAGTYLTGQIVVPSNTALVCDKGAIFKRASTVTSAQGDAPPLVVTGGDNIEVRGCEIDLNAPTANNLYTAIGPIGSTNHIVIRGNYVHGGAFSGINYPAYANWTHTDLIIEDNKIDDFGLSAITANNVTLARVCRNTASRTGYHMIDVERSSHLLVCQNRLNNAAAPTLVYPAFLPRQAGAFIFYGPTNHDFQFLDNDMDTNHEFDGIGLTEDGVNTATSGVIAGNNIRNVDGSGIDVSSEMVVANNVITGSNAHGRSVCLLFGLDFGGTIYNAVASNNHCINTLPIRFGHPIPLTMTITTTARSNKATITSRASTESGTRALIYALPKQSIVASSVPAGTTIASVDSQPSGANTSYTVTLSVPATLSGAFDGTAQGLMAYRGIEIAGNFANIYLTSDANATPAIAFEQLNQSYNKVRIHDNLWSGAGGPWFAKTGLLIPANKPGVPDSTSADGDVQLDELVPFNNATITGVGGSPSNATIDELFSVKQSAQTVQLTIYSGTALNGATGLSFNVPNISKGTGFLRCQDATVLGPVFDAVVRNGTSNATMNFPNALAADHRYDCSGTFSVF